MLSSSSKKFSSYPGTRKIILYNCVCISRTPTCSLLHFGLLHFGYFFALSTLLSYLLSSSPVLFWGLKKNVRWDKQVSSKMKKITKREKNQIRNDENDKNDKNDKKNVSFQEKKNRKNDNYYWMVPSPVSLNQNKLKS